MRFLRNLLVVLLGLILASSAGAQGTGRSLDIQPGGRQNGMGAAGVAVADDPTGATWWNPAALGFVNRKAVELTYAQLVPSLASDVSYNYLTYVHPVQGWGALGLGVVFLSYGQSDRTGQTGDPQGTFGSNEFSPALYYGTQILPEFALGASLKYIRIQLDPDNPGGVGATFGLDLASLYRIPAARLSLGMNVQNLGPSVAFVDADKADPLGRNIKAGFAWEAYSNKNYGALMVGDFNQSLVTNDFRTYNGGLELRYADQLAGRIGWYEDPLGDISDFTYGIGVTFKGLNLDLGSIPEAKDSGLGYVKKLTLGYRF
ncbi:MAG TPA: PorV/PorQ family protein [Candidatus Eisenbacteria bacterium]|jgi:hypothetical protein